MLFVKALISAGKSAYCAFACTDDINLAPTSSGCSDDTEWSDISDLQNGTSTSASTSTSRNTSHGDNDNHSQSQQHGKKNRSSPSSKSQNSHVHIKKHKQKQKQQCLIPMKNIEQLLDHQNSKINQSLKYHQKRDSCHYHNTDAASIGVVSRGDSDVFSADTEVRGNRNKYSYSYSSNNDSHNMRRPSKRSSNHPRKIGGGRSITSGSSSSFISNDKYYSPDDAGSDDKSIKSTKSTISGNIRVTSNMSNISISSNYNPNTLEIKTKAHMPDFYMDSWIMMFPSFRVPHDMSKMSYESNRKNSNSNSNNNSTISSNSKQCQWENQSSDNPLRKEMYQHGLPIQLTSDNSTALDLVLLGSLGLVQDRQRFPTKSTSRASNLKSYLVLGDKSTGRIVALCSLKSSKGKPIIRIFATKPRSSKQVAAVDTSTLGLTEDTSIPLYAWAEFRSEGHFPNKKTKYHLHSSTGNEGEFHANPIFTARHKFPETSQLLEITQMSNNDIGREVCASVNIRTSTKWCEEETYYALSVSKSVDMASIVCFTAIIDEVMEFSMRKQCANAAWKHKKSVTISKPDKKWAWI